MTFSFAVHVNSHDGNRQRFCKGSEFLLLSSHNSDETGAWPHRLPTSNVTAGSSVATELRSGIKERGQRKRHCSSQWQEAALHEGEASEGERKMG